MPSQVHAALRDFDAPYVRIGLCVTSIAGPYGDAQLFERDEVGPFEFGNQVPISSHRKLLRLNFVERCGNVGTVIPAGKVEGGERKRNR
jgi:hypothetical protein